jgi:hypothetical protein
MMAPECIPRLFLCAAFLVQRSLDVLYSSIMSLCPSFMVSNIYLCLPPPRRWLTNSISLELGHGIHDLLSRTSYVRFHGHRAPPDFAEAPSVMLENWCWMKDELKQMSYHYTKLDPKFLDKWQDEHPEAPCPPDEIPDNMLNCLVKSGDLNRALWFLYQL